ncbi:hypothetical protein PSHT_07066 [Puccinia striiformis]|uniref:Uncharacterized protein n=1 Tax=Puccinia striiformis TaxID=27350 RepID=A0A2S4W0Y0_9BASI|nr:hypothetical protein PSHT_07066 [Puccinia striiformis]
MNDEPPVTRLVMAGNYSTTSPLIPPHLPAGNSSPCKPLSSPITSNASSSSTPNLHRKLSAKFLRRKNSSATKTTNTTPHSSPTIAGGGKDAPSSSTSAYQHHHHQPVLSSPLGPDHQFERSQQSFSPRPIQASNQYINLMINGGPYKPTPSPTEFKRSTPNPTPHSVLLTSSSILVLNQYHFIQFYEYTS